MSKIAFVFPGQGTHYVGMGMELADRYPEASAVFEQANAVMGMDIRRLCREGPESELVKTENSQPTIHTTALALLKVVEKYGFQADVTAGFSLGEYAALVYAGVFRFEDTVKLVKQRGMFMQNAVPQGVGKMCWITGLSRETVQEIVDESQDQGLIECSNFNCPNQIIVAGHAAAVEKAAALASVPYDVVDTAEARALAARRSGSTSKSWPAMPATPSLAAWSMPGAARRTTLSSSTAARCRPSGRC